MNNAVLTLSHITRSYKQGDGELIILNQLNLELRAGEMVALVGPSGSGKSTLLHIAGLLDTPNSGEIRIGDDILSNADEEKRTLARRKYIGFVYQFHHLLPEFSALENVMLPQLIAGISARAARAKGEALLAEMGLQQRMSHRPGKLSGGEQQRVAIARALANDPALLLADEPTGNLDHGTAESVFELLTHVAREKNVAMLVATHNPDLAQRMDRIVKIGF